MNENCRACGRIVNLYDDRHWLHPQGGVACDVTCAQRDVPVPWLKRVPQLIAFTGVAGSGKTAAAKALQRHGFTIHPFAAPIKAAMKALGVPDEALTAEGKAIPLALLCNRSPREVMQTLGTEWGRQMVGDDLWLRVWEATRPPGPIVVDDLRFLNEAKLLQPQGALIIKVHRPDLPRTQVGLLGHRSETEMADIEVDDTIFNIGDERTYGIVVRELVESYAGR